LQPEGFHKYLVSKFGEPKTEKEPAQWGEVVGAYSQFLPLVDDNGKFLKDLTPEVTLKEIH